MSNNVEKVLKLLSEASDILAVLPGGLDAQIHVLNAVRSLEVLLR